MRRGGGHYYQKNNYNPNYGQSAYNMGTPMPMIMNGQQLPVMQAPQMIPMIANQQVPMPMTQMPAMSSVSPMMDPNSAAAIGQLIADKQIREEKEKETSFIAQMKAAVTETLTGSSAAAGHDKAPTGAPAGEQVNFGLCKAIVSGVTQAMTNMNPFMSGQSPPQQYYQMQSYDGMRDHHRDRSRSRNRDRDRDRDRDRERNRPSSSVRRQLVPVSSDEGPTPKEKEEAARKDVLKTVSKAAGIDIPIIDLTNDTWSQNLGDSHGITQDAIKRVLKKNSMPTSQGSKKAMLEALYEHLIK